MSSRQRTKSVILGMLATSVIATALFFAGHALGRYVEMGGDRSYMYTPTPGDWRIETDGIQYRYAAMDSSGVWVPSETFDTPGYARYVAKARSRRTWEPL